MLWPVYSALLGSGKAIGEIEREHEREMCNVNKGLIDNKLALHLGKTECVSCNSKKKVKTARDLRVTINDVAIKVGTNGF